MQNVMIIVFFLINFSSGVESDADVAATERMSGAAGTTIGIGGEIVRISS